MSQGELASGLTPLILVRHGETDWNRAGRVQGMRDLPLNELGRAQARATAGVLAREQVTAIFASDLGRARQTAEVIAHAAGVPVIEDARLRERSYGVIEGHTWEEVEIRFPDAWARLSERQIDYAPPQGESAAQFQSRALGVLTEIAERCAGQRVVVVTHGGVVGMLYRHVANMPLDARRDYPLLNASINRFRYVQSRWQLEVWGDVSHLEGLDAADER